MEFHVLSVMDRIKINGVALENNTQITLEQALIRVEKNSC